SSTSALSGGEVTDEGDSSVSARGVVWDTNQNPTLADQSTDDGSGTGAFTSQITNLNTGTTYYIRAYATNSEGTSYGNQVTFTPTSTLVLATVTTTAASNLASTTLTSGGNITSDGGSPVTARG